MYSRDGNLLDRMGPLIAQMDETRPRIKRKVLKRGIDYAIARKTGYDEGVNDAFESPYGKNLIATARKDTYDKVIGEGKKRVGDISNVYKRQVAEATHNRITNLLRKLRGNKGFAEDEHHKTIKNAAGMPLPATGKTGAEGFLLRSAETGLPILFVPSPMEFGKRVHRYLDTSDRRGVTTDAPSIRTYLNTDFNAIENLRKSDFHKANKEMMRLMREDPKYWEKKLASAPNEQVRATMEHSGPFRHPELKHFYTDKFNPYEIRGTYIREVKRGDEMVKVKKPILISRIDRMPYKQIADDILRKTDISIDAIERELNRVFEFPEEAVPEFSPELEKTIIKSYQKGVKEHLAKTVPTGIPKIPRAPPLAIKESEAIRLAKGKEKATPELEEMLRQVEEDKRLAELEKELLEEAGDEITIGSEEEEEDISEIIKKRV